MEDFIQTRFGYCYYEVRETRALIYGLFVHPEYRMQGKAKRLLTLVINEIREAGHSGDIEIEVAPKEDGIDPGRLALFYTSMGLKVLDRVGIYPPCSGGDGAEGHRRTSLDLRG